MKILGIGVDIVNNQRFKKLIKNKNFIKRTYSANEIKFSIKKKDKVYFFAIVITNLKFASTISFFAIRDSFSPF